MAIQCNLVFLTNFDLPSIYILGMQSACSSVQQLNRIILVEDKEKNTFFTEVSSHWTWKKSNWVSNLSIITTPGTKHWPEYDCGMCKHYTMTQCVVVVLMKPRFWFYNWSVHHKWLWWVACWEHWSDQSQNRKPGTVHTAHLWLLLSLQFITHHCLILLEAINTEHKYLRSWWPANWNQLWSGHKKRKYL